MMLAQAKSVSGETFFTRCEFLVHSHHNHDGADDCSQRLLRQLHCKGPY